jgi:hypothetical protein
MKIDIVESPFIPATRKSVCSHLQPILEKLINYGCTFDWSTGVIPDKGDGNILLAEKHMDIEKIKEDFNIPDFLNLDGDRQLIFCKKCWCSLLKKEPGKVFNSTIQPTY